MWQDGVHVATKATGEVEVTEEQKKMMRTQDIRYVEMKRVAEVKVSPFFPQQGIMHKIKSFLNLEQKKSYIMVTTF